MRHETTPSTSKNVNKISVPDGHGVKFERSIVIQKPAQELYNFWRNFENLPRFMGHLKSVTSKGEGTSHWAARALAGKIIEWDSEIIEDHPNHFISWRSLPGSEFHSAGSVWFTELAEGSGTEVKVIMKYEPPGGMLGTAVAKVFGQAPEQQMADDLRRLKWIMEDDGLGSEDETRH